MALFGSVFGLICMFLKVDEAGSYPPPLTRDEENDCFNRMRDPDPKIRDKAREKLILHNLRLVSHIVKKYYGSGQNQEDLISIGTIGLIKAIDSFDPDNGTRFATYAGKCLQNEILMHFRAGKKTQNDISLDDTIEIDKEGNPLTYMDVISCEDTIAEDLFMRMSSKKAFAIIRDELSKRQREIIIRRYGLDGKEPETQREIAVRLGISRSYVSRIEKAALDRIGEELKRQGGA